MHLQTRNCGLCHHKAPQGPIPLCTCSYMAYLLNRTFTAPQGADCSDRQTESWEPQYTLALPPFCTLLPTPPPRPHQMAPTLPWAEELFQLHFKLRSRGSTSVEAPCDLLSNSAVQNTRYTSCVWVLLKYCSTYIIKYIPFLCSITQRGASVFLSWQGYQPGKM